MTRLTVVIVTVKSDTSLVKCLASLATQSFTEFDVIVICNGCSAPGKLDTPVVGRFEKRTRFIVTSNRGYGAACNIGARHSDSPYLVFLNDDTELHPQCLAKLYDSLSKDQNAIFQPSTLHEYIRRVMTGNPCDIYGAAGLGFYGNCGTGEFYASGASLAVSRKVLDSLGGFDENLYLYHDDLDLSWRARLMGYGISSNVSAFCKHTGGASSRTMPHAFKFYLTQRNRLRVLIKNYSTRRMLIRVAAALLMIVAGATFFTVKTRKVQYLISIYKTFGWNLLELKSTLLERYRVQGKRIRDDDLIERNMCRYSMDLCVLKRYIIGASRPEQVALRPLRLSQPVNLDSTFPSL
jgi:GT2 family glycosyltransferase